MSDERGEAFHTILEYIEDELSFATSHYNNSYLDRRISSRMRRTQSGTYEEYFELLQADENEQVALLDSMSINVTSFFRNPDVWAGIRDVLRGLSKTNDTIRVWSAACADGREPYSISILAHADPQIDESIVQVLGTDISEPALKTARAAVYEASESVNIGEQLDALGDYTKFVEVDGRQYRIRPNITQNVSFERHDLINGDAKSGFDLVVCRNLFIYIDNEYKQPILTKISNSLNPGGYLVIGKAETIPPNLKSAFDVREARLRIYQHNPSDSDTELTTSRADTGL